MNDRRRHRRQDNAASRSSEDARRAAGATAAEPARVNQDPLAWFGLWCQSRSKVRRDNDHEFDGGSRCNGCGSWSAGRCAFGDRCSVACGIRHGCIGIGRVSRDRFRLGGGAGCAGPWLGRPCWAGGARSYGLGRGDCSGACPARPWLDRPRRNERAAGSRHDDPGPCHGLACCDGGHDGRAFGELIGRPVESDAPGSRLSGLSWSTPVVHAVTAGIRDTMAIAVAGPAGRSRDPVAAGPAHRCGYAGARPAGPAPGAGRWSTNTG